MRYNVHTLTNVVIWYSINVIWVGMEVGYKCIVSVIIHLQKHAHTEWSVQMRQVMESSCDLVFLGKDGNGVK